MNLLQLDDLGLGSQRASKPCENGVLAAESSLLLKLRLLLDLLLVLLVDLLKVLLQLHLLLPNGLLDLPVALELVDLDFSD